MFRIAYGGDFAMRGAVDESAFVASLGETAERYLLANPVR
jgi:hypothetical protein